MLYNFLEYIGIGNKAKNNGILFLTSISERKTRIEVGYGLEGRITDGKAGQILDNYVVPYLKNNDWNEGITNGFNAILKEISDEYNIKIIGANNPTNIQFKNSIKMFLPPQEFIDTGKLIWLYSGISIFFICYIINTILNIIEDKAYKTTIKDYRTYRIKQIRFRFIDKLIIGLRNCIYKNFYRYF